MCLRWWYLPVLHLPVELLFSLTNHPSPKVDQITLAVIFVQERWLEPASKVTKHISKSLPVPINEDS